MKLWSNEAGLAVAEKMIVVAILSFGVGGTIKLLSDKAGEKADEQGESISTFEGGTPGNGTTGTTSGGGVLPTEQVNLPTDDALLPGGGTASNDGEIAGQASGGDDTIDVDHVALTDSGDQTWETDTEIPESGAVVADNTVAPESDDEAPSFLSSLATVVGDYARYSLVPDVFKSPEELAAYNNGAADTLTDAATGAWEFISSSASAVYDYTTDSEYRNDINDMVADFVVDTATAAGNAAVFAYNNPEQALLNTAAWIEDTTEAVYDWGVEKKDEFVEGVHETAAVIDNGDREEIARMYGEFDAAAALVAAEVVVAAAGGVVVSGVVRGTKGVRMVAAATPDTPQYFDGEGQLDPDRPPLQVAANDNVAGPGEVVPGRGVNATNDNDLVLDPNRRNGVGEGEDWFVYGHHGEEGVGLTNVQEHVDVMIDNGLQPNQPVFLNVCHGGHCALEVRDELIARGHTDARVVGNTDRVQSDGTAGGQWIDTADEIKVISNGAPIPDGAKHIYRGVPNLPEDKRFQDAMQGRVEPWETNFSDQLDLHDTAGRHQGRYEASNTMDTDLTSWTTRPNIAAKDYAFPNGFEAAQPGDKGYMLVDRASESRTTSYQYDTGDGEVLRKGNYENLRVIEVTKGEDGQAHFRVIREGEFSEPPGTTPNATPAGSATAPKPEPEAEAYVPQVREPTPDLPPLEFDM